MIWFCAIRKQYETLTVNMYVLAAKASAGQPSDFLRFFPLTIVVGSGEALLEALFGTTFEGVGTPFGFGFEGRREDPFV
jgi:hypothetical protein